ncbi:MAG: TetR/AcrR family transcriptional regulator C-terminal domain-containing protein [Clostridia bacterium]|nr:TetR/AcrR family transcriptional regulator C-terminal domain-containing protein [Clostridia bacterium]
MADSSITKMALANSLKTLMQEKSFHKISINDICTGCNMNRKSFYYHFKDKYDLLNWIFDTEFQEFAIRSSSLETWDLTLGLCYYLYENRKFYRKALAIDGQNSFHSHLYDILYEKFYNELNILFNEDENETPLDEIQAQFITDGVMSALERWLLSHNNMTADEFIEKLRSLVTRLIKAIHKKYSNDK